MPKNPLLFALFLYIFNFFLTIKWKNKRESGRNPHEARKYGIFIAHFWILKPGVNWAFDQDFTIFVRKILQNPSKFPKITTNLPNFQHQNRAYPLSTNIKVGETSSGNVFFDMPNVSELVRTAAYRVILNKFDEYFSEIFHTVWVKI